MKLNDGNVKGESIVAINYNLFFISFLKIARIEFKMKLQSSFVWNFSKFLQNHDFSYFSPHLFEWNKSKLPIFIKIHIIRRHF